jgi:hypothetical protein
MKMSKYQRRPDLEQAMKEQYKDDFEVMFKPVNQNQYLIQINHKGKSATLNEHMNNGLTKFVILTTDKSITYKKYFEAELDAVEYLRS